MAFGGYKPLGLILAETEANVYSFGIQGPFFIINRIAISTGVVQWAFTAPHNSGSYQSLELLVLADGSSVLIAVTGTGSNRIYAKLIISSVGTVTYSIKFTESTSDSL